MNWTAFSVGLFNARHVQKGHPTLVTQVDLIQPSLYHRCIHLLWDTAIFTISHFLSEILEDLW